jgi:hypothetical protein
MDAFCWKGVTGITKILSSDIIAIYTNIEEKISNFIKNH